MSLLHIYSAPPQLTLDELEKWVNQIEGVSKAKTVALKTYKSPPMSRAVVDLHIRKPASRARVRMGHIPTAGDDIFGQAYVTGQPMDVTLYR